MFVCLFVSLFVCLCVRGGLSQKPLRGFFRNLARSWGVVKSVRNVARPVFWDFCPFSRKLLICAKKIHFWQFLRLCRKSVPRIFLKFCQNVLKKIVLKDRTVVSPGKILYFWDFRWSYIQKLTSTTQNFDFFRNFL